MVLVLRVRVICLSNSKYFWNLSPKRDCIPILKLLY